MSIDQWKIDSISKILRKPHVNSTCIWCNACVSISGNVFELNDDGLSHVRSCDTYEWQDVDDAISACPVNAISWQKTNADWEYADGLFEHSDPQ